MGTNIMIDFSLRFELNFDESLWSCFKCIDMFELLKFSLPEHLRLIAMRKEKCSKNVNAVIRMLKMYNAIVEKLTPPQVSFYFAFALVLNIYLTALKWSTDIGFDYCGRCAISSLRMTERVALKLGVGFRRL